MLKTNFMRIVLVLGCALILIGVVLMAWMLATDEKRNVVEVDLDDGETETIGFESLKLLPGEECEYSVTLKRESTKKYNLTLEFVETEEKTLKKFARVKIFANGEVVYDELLETAFEDDAIVLPVDVGTNKNTELKFVYYLPLDVGNEAKKAEAIFELQMTASNE